MLMKYFCFSSFFDRKAWFVMFAYPYFVRGAYFVHGFEAGMFTFHLTLGYAYYTNSFRVVLLWLEK